MGRQRKEQAPPDHTELELTIPGQIISAGDGEFYIVQPNMEILYPEADLLTQRYCDLFVSVCNSKADPGRELKKFLNANPESIVFLDIETMGLFNAPLFLIGLLYFNGKSFVIDQLFARDYSEEANLLHYFSQFIPRFSVLVTFNGKSFDVPFIIDRMTYHGKVLQAKQIHIDILHHSRRRWRGRVTNCKLQTLESEIFGRRRVADIPSALVPEVYRDFVRTGNTQLLVDVFHHNALDLITLLELTMVLLSQ